MADGRHFKSTKIAIYPQLIKLSQLILAEWRLGPLLIPLTHRNMNFLNAAWQRAVI